MQKSALIVFFKPPISGEVKTRLAGKIGNDAAARIYRAMLHDLADEISDVSYDVFPMCSTHRKTGDIPWSGWALQAQGDLGDRMSAAFVEIFAKGYQDGLLIGSDIPEISSGILRKCFLGIRDRGMAIGPATDGGYYGIGLSDSCYHPGLFSDIKWSTDRVYNKTLSIAKKHQIDPFVGPLLKDVDTYEDLAALIEKLSSHRNRNLLAAWRELDFFPHLS